VEVPTGSGEENSFFAASLIPHLPMIASIAPENSRRSNGTKEHDRFQCLRIGVDRQGKDVSESSKLLKSLGITNE
jgi:hypothetical protein